MRLSLLAISITGALVVSACGGGGSAEPDPAPAPTPTAPTPPPTPTPVTTESKIDAARLLNQATFGATVNTIQQVAQSTPGIWLQGQFTTPVTRHVDIMETLDLTDSEGEYWRSHRMYAWWDAAVYGEDQLRQRVAFALSQILVISDRSVFGNEQLAIAHYYDVLLDNSFGNFRELIEAVTLSPLMGIYLSMLGNEKPDDIRNIRPDENYARELMQLFSIGLVELNQDGSVKLDGNNQPIATYDQATIEHYAHVFTGWHFQGATEDTWYYWWDNFNVFDPMVPVQAFHATNEKALLNGVIAPAGELAEDDLELALDSLFFHPNVGPFISKQLIQKLVTSNPSPDYVQRVAQAFADNGFGVRGDMQAVISAILLDEEARNVPDADSSFGKLREPLVKFAHMIRALDGGTQSGLVDLPYPDYFANQAPLSAPSVFNFFSPTYTTPGELAENSLVAPELEIMTETYVVRATNFFAYTALWSHSIEDNTDPKRYIIDYSREVALLDTPEELIDHINFLFLAGNMTDTMQAILEQAINESENQEPEERIANLMFLVLASPQFAVQR